MVTKLWLQHVEEMLRVRFFFLKQYVIPSNFCIGGERMLAPAMLVITVPKKVPLQQLAATII